MEKRRSRNGKDIVEYQVIVSKCRCQVFNGTRVVQQAIEAETPLVVPGVIYSSPSPSCEPVRSALNGQYPILCRYCVLSEYCLRLVFYNNAIPAWPILLFYSQ